MGSAFTELVQQMLSSLVSIITGIANSIKEGLLNLLFNSNDDYEANFTPSAFGYFVFFALGITLAIGLSQWITNLIRMKI